MKDRKSPKFRIYREGSFRHSLSMVSLSCGRGRGKPLKGGKGEHLLVAEGGLMGFGSSPRCRARRLPRKGFLELGWEGRDFWTWGRSWSDNRSRGLEETQMKPCSAELHSLPRRKRILASGLGVSVRIVARRHHIPVGRLLFSCGYMKSPRL